MNAEDRARTSAQAQKIIDRLKRGPALNTELAVIALKYTSRISDARKRGFDIRCERVGGGVMRYFLLNKEVA